MRENRWPATKLSTLKQRSTSTSRLVGLAPRACYDLFLTRPIYRDYTKSIEVFDEIVAKDETEFKPLGSKIGEYARRLKKPDPASVKGKGKAKAETNGNGSSSKSMWENCEVTDEDAVVFEAYQVSKRNIDLRGRP